MFLHAIGRRFSSTRGPQSRSTSCRQSTLLSQIRQFAFPTSRDAPPHRLMSIAWSDKSRVDTATGTGVRTLSPFPEWGMDIKSHEKSLFPQRLLFVPTAYCTREP